MAIYVLATTAPEVHRSSPVVILCNFYFCHTSRARILFQSSPEIVTVTLSGGNDWVTKNLSHNGNSFPKLIFRDFAQCHAIFWAYLGFLWSFREMNKYMCFADISFCILTTASFQMLCDNGFRFSVSSKNIKSFTESKIISTRNFAASGIFNSSLYRSIESRNLDSLNQQKSSD